MFKNKSFRKPIQDKIHINFKFHPSILNGFIFKNSYFEIE